MFCFSILYYIQQLKPIIAVKNADLKTQMGPSYGPFLHCMMGDEFTKMDAWIYKNVNFHIISIIMLLVISMLSDEPWSSFNW